METRRILVIPEFDTALLERLFCTGLLLRCRWPTERAGTDDDPSDCIGYASVRPAREMGGIRAHATSSARPFPTGQCRCINGCIDPGSHPLVE